MKLWNRFVVAGLVLALVFCFGMSPAAAASKKKKKEEKKKEETVVRHHERSEKKVIDGLNIAGKPGYFFNDTADSLNKGQVVGAAHLTLDTWGSVFQIPVGVSYGITDKLLINVNSAFFASNGLSGLNYVGFGGKYSFGKITKDDTDLKLAVGLDFNIAPLYTSAFGTDFAFDPYGVVTWTAKDGLQLNGKLGIFVQTYSYSFGPFSYTGSWSYFQLGLGAAYPFDRDLSGFAELDTNGLVYAGGVGGSPLIVGIRTGHDVQLQAFGGFDLGGPVGLLLGGGVALFSK